MRVLLFLLASTVQAADVPFYLRDLTTQKDVAGLNENFRSVVGDLTKLRADVDSLDAEDDGTVGAVLGGTQTWSGGNSLYGNTTFYGDVFIPGGVHRGPDSGALLGVSDVVYAVNLSSVARSSGCVVAAWASGTGPDAYLVFASTNGCNSTGCTTVVMRVIQDATCAPSAICRIAGGIQRVYSGLSIGVTDHVGFGAVPCETGTTTSWNGYGRANALTAIGSAGMTWISIYR